MTRLLRGGRTLTTDLDYRITEVNGGRAVLISSGETPVAVLVLGVQNGLITTITAHSNPDKLTMVRVPG